MWELTEAIDFINRVNQAFSAAKLPVEVAMTGGVLKNRWSNHDLDIILFPRRTTSIPVVAAIQECLMTLELTMTHNVHAVHAHWRKNRNSMDTKHVEVWHDANRRRIDFIYLEFGLS